MGATLGGTSSASWSCRSPPDAKGWEQGQPGSLIQTCSCFLLSGAPCKAALQGSSAMGERLTFEIQAVGSFLSSPPLTSSKKGKQSLKLKNGAQ